MLDRFKAVAALSVSLALAATLPAFGQGEIKIGSLSALTGAASQPGQSQRDAVQMVVNEVNAKGGIKGQKIRLLVEDDQLSPTAAANAARKLVYQDKVFAIIGTPNSPTALSALEVTMEGKVPQLVQGVAPKITQMANPYVLRVTPVDSILAEILVNYAVRTRKVNKLAILSDSTDYGRGGRDSAVAALTKVGLKAVTAESFNNDDQDFSSQINKIKASGANGLVLWGFYVQGARIVAQAKKLGLDVPIFASSGVLQGNFLELTGGAAEGIHIVSYFSTADSAPNVQAFVKKFRDTYKRDPDPVAGLGYDSINLLIEAIEKVGANREKVVAYLKSIKNWPGVTGSKTGAPNGELGVGGIIVQIKGGKPETVWRSK
ncbi:MAG: ABC transporter substrate-binding protein [Burkholderiales bacterium]|nr:ABC transporter substrate-binding protein [Burkholderiales bacterium]